MGRYAGKVTDPFYCSAAWRRLRKVALERDHYKCVLCMRDYLAGISGRPRDAVVVHHIVPRSEAPERELELDNLMSLCEVCHNKVHPEKGAQDSKAEKAAPCADGVRIIRI